MKICFTIFLCLIGGMSAVLRAELAWEHAELALTAASGQGETLSVFKFTNRGNKPVRILSVHPSCGCTSAKPQLDLIAPGASGELSAKTSLLGRQGMVSIAIAVTTDEASSSTYNLALKVTIADPVEMVPRLLNWRAGESPVPKKITLKLGPGVTVTGANVHGDGFSAKLEPGSGNERVLWITPLATNVQAAATVQILAEQDHRSISGLKAFLRTTP